VSAGFGSSGGQPTLLLARYSSIRILEVGWAAGSGQVRDNDLTS
jgi:hypothetical protein